MLRNRLIPILITTAGLSMPTAAQETPAADKSAYTLWNPTPRELWRPLSADRPDITESPYTVDAGAFQLEMSFVDYARNGDLEAITVAPLNVKVGLLNNADLQLVLDPYIDIDSDDDADDADGFGDTIIRYKMNLWGNDAGETAFAIMPFVKFPTASDDLGNDEFEGGVIFPFACDVADGVGLGLMGEFDFVYDEPDDAYDIEFVHSAVLGFDITEQLGSYIEGVGIVSSDGDRDYRAFVGTGATYAINENTVLDAGVNVGLTGNADDFNIFTGITIRF